VLATSLPLLLPTSHPRPLEAWNEAICGGAWGEAPRRAPVRRMRCAADLGTLGGRSGSRSRNSGRLLSGPREPGRTASPPASITVISGDIHPQLTWAAVDFPVGTDSRSAVYQAGLLADPQFVCRTRSAAGSGWLHHVRGELIANCPRLGLGRGGASREIRWRITHGPLVLQTCSPFLNSTGARHASGSNAPPRT